MVISYNTFNSIVDYRDMINHHCGGISYPFNSIVDYPYWLDLSYEAVTGFQFYSRLSWSLPKYYYFVLTSFNSIVDYHTVQHSASLSVSPFFQFYSRLSKIPEKIIEGIFEFFQFYSRLSYLASKDLSPLYSPSFNSIVDYRGKAKETYH